MINRYSRSIINLAFTFFIGGNILNAQTLDSVIENPEVYEINKLSARATFFSFESEELAFNEI